MHGNKMPCKCIENSNWIATERERENELFKYMCFARFKNDQINPIEYTQFLKYDRWLWQNELRLAHTKLKLQNKLPIFSYHKQWTWASYCHLPSNIHCYLLVVVFFCFNISIYNLRLLFVGYGYNMMKAIPILTFHRIGKGKQQQKHQQNYKHLSTTTTKIRGQRANLHLKCNSHDYSCYWNVCVCAPCCIVRSCVRAYLALFRWVLIFLNVSTFIVLFFSLDILWILWIICFLWKKKYFIFVCTNERDGWKCVFVTHSQFVEDISVLIYLRLVIYKS